MNVLLVGEKCLWLRVYLWKHCAVFEIFMRYSISDFQTDWHVCDTKEEKQILNIRMRSFQRDVQFEVKSDFRFCRILPFLYHVTFRLHYNIQITAKYLYKGKTNVPLLRCYNRAIFMQQNFDENVGKLMKLYHDL